MFNRAKEVLDGAIEFSHVRSFLDHSKDLKKMRHISLTSKDGPYTSVIEDIEKSTSFKELLEHTDRMDFEHTKDPSVQKVGKNVMKAILFFGGYFKNETNFGYYMRQFRENVIKYMADKGYSMEHVQRKEMR